MKNKITVPISKDLRERIVYNYEKHMPLKQIEDEFGVSKSSIYNFVNMKKKKLSLNPKIVNRKGYLNPHAKVTKSYLEKIKKIATENNHLNQKQLSKKMEEKTGIKVSPSDICKIEKNLNLTKKKYSTTYSESNSDVNQFRKTKYLKEHDPRSTKKMKGYSYRSLLLSCATDESGWDNNIVKTYGIGMIHKNPPIKIKQEKLDSGRSYRNNETRIYKTKLKHPKFKLNVIASICLDLKKPVPYYQINDEYTNGSVFGDFVENRNLPDHIKYDIIDRHSSHKSINANIERGDIPVKENYLSKNIIEDFTPAGKPQFNPCECLFSYIDKYLENESEKYNKGQGWKKDEMKKVIGEAITKVSFKHVQGWYKRTWIELYKNRKYPIYLRSNVSKSKFQNEIKRHVLLFEKNNNKINKSSRGRIIIKKEY